MGFGWKRMALKVRDNVGNGDDEMLFGGDSGGAPDRRSLVNQRDEALRASRADRLRQFRKRANVDAGDQTNPPETGKKPHRL